MNETQVQPETEDHPPEPGDTESTERAPSTTARIVVIIAALFFNVLAPLGLFYGLRAAGMSIWVALLAGTVPPAAHYLWQFVRERKVDSLGLFMITMIALAAGTSLLIGDPRLLLAKEAALTFVAGLWILGTLLTKLPFIYRLMVPVMPTKQVTRLEVLWKDSPKTRRLIRLNTLVWGLGFLIDSVARVIVAYTLPLDSVPAVSVALIVALIFGLHGYTQLHLKLSGFFDAVKRNAPMEGTV